MRLVSGVDELRIGLDWAIYGRKAGDLHFNVTPTRFPLAPQLVRITPITRIHKHPNTQHPPKWSNSRSFPPTEPQPVH